MIITNNIIGKIKELHGVNCAPYSDIGGIDQRSINQLFTFCGIPNSRTHDVNGAYGGTYFIDIPNIFRNFDADVDDEKSYDFYYTDEYITAVIKAGTKIVYRLGVTIEWGSKKYVANPPKDNLKWAKICEHIIAHYNKGWANGFNYDIEYWEIWNEPENPPMWTGTREQFLELYKVASKYLKSKYPELKIGGYGSCGFYAVFRMDQSDFMKSFIDWFDEFLKMCKKENCPLDFYSWHIYTSNADEIIKSANYVRAKLDEYGFTKTESHLNEWNYGAEGGGFNNMATLIGSAFISTALIKMQNSPNVDKAMYYALNNIQSYNAFWDLRTKELTSVAFVYRAFSKIFKAQNQLEVKIDFGEPPVVASRDNKKIYCMMSNYNSMRKIFRLKIDGCEDKIGKLYRLTDKHGFVFEKEFDAGEDDFYLPADSVYYFEVQI